MIKSSGTKGRLRQAERGAHKDQLGVGFDILSDKEFGANGKSIVDGLIRQRFNLACEGDLPAIRQMVRLIRANLKGRKETYPGVILRGDINDRKPEPHNADMAMVVLGIAGFDDATLADVGLASEDSATWYVRGLRPNRLEQWVVDFAASEGLAGDTDPRSRRQVTKAMIEEDRSNVRTWDAYRERIVAKLTRERGPGATRFKPGVSGNRAGRPHKYEPEFPYDDFLTEAVPVTLKGEVRTMTRLDALVVKLGVMALTNHKIAAAVVGLATYKHELEWNEVEEVEDFIRG